MKQTEKRHAEGSGLETRSDQDILSLLARGQADAALSVTEALPAISQAAELATQSIRARGRLVYAAAGSSGLMALADALELPGTYGIAREQIVILLAGGMAVLQDLKGGPEDDGEAARNAVEVLQLGADDCLLAVTASGHTPYAVEAAKAARAAGAKTIGLANNPGVALFDTVDVAICLPTPAEVVAGSTRMGAGTAQKIALNMFSTLMAIRLGHVHDGLMVNLLADNEKLRGRAIGIVAEIAKVGPDQATKALDVSSGRVKAAVLIAAGAESVENANELLELHHGFLGPALLDLVK